MWLNEICNLNNCLAKGSSENDSDILERCFISFIQTQRNFNSSKLQRPKFCNFKIQAVGLEKLRLEFYLPEVFHQISHVVIIACSPTFLLTSHTDSSSFPESRSSPDTFPPITNPSLIHDTSSVSCFHQPSQAGTCLCIF